MNNDTYGLIPENPIKLKSEQAAIAFLESLVTKHDGYHILFHKLMSFDFNLFDGKKETAENTSEIYQIYTNNQKIITLFFNIHYEDCVWIPPAGFEFESEFISVWDKEMTYKSEAEYNIVKVDKKYVNTIRENWTTDDYNMIDPDCQESILYRSWGVNYKTCNFPHELWEKYIKENTVCISDLTEEQRELREKALAEY